MTIAIAPHTMSQAQCSQYVLSYIAGSRYG
ncbi:hypothetical protein FHY02_000381 [Sphingomonas sp. BK069]|nr:hypothetical protein [Sphingomonas sp. BK069]MBB3474463.1 hypothetical protein [Sphingomonas sp. BK345]